MVGSFLLILYFNCIINLKHIYIYIQTEYILFVYVTNKINKIPLQKQLITKYTNNITKQTI